MGELLVVRLHTDAGQEFVNKAVNEMLKDIKIFPTTTGGYDPRANGRAERYVGLIKQRATSYLIHSKTPSQILVLGSESSGLHVPCQSSGRRGSARRSHLWEQGPVQRP